MEKKDNKEIEVRFLLRDLPKFAANLVCAGAICVRPRYLEINELFDTPDKRLNRNFETLRLRTDWTHKITYKRALTFNIRKEIEFEVSNINSAREMINELGYARYLYFEKYRSMFEWDGAQVTIDETPIGAFVEIEDSSLDKIEDKSVILNLDWDAQVRKSYFECFQAIQEKDGSLESMTFESFGGWLPSSLDLGLEYAD